MSGPEPLPFPTHAGRRRLEEEDDALWRDLLLQAEYLHRVKRLPWKLCASHSTVRCHASTLRRWRRRALAERNAQRSA
ncbi:MAG TPA: hypothetical protein VIU62_10950 [Chloroflexota bacterium]|jgi:hypothetical protein